MSDRVVYSFPKNRRKEVRATLSTYRGHRLADIRVFVVDEDEPGLPTKKGIAVRVEDLPKLLEAVRMLIEAERAA